MVLHQVTTTKFVVSVTSRSVMIVSVQFNTKSYLWTIKV